MRIKPVLATIFMVTIFLPACKQYAVKLEYTNAKGEVPQMGNLVFRFDKSLMKDSLLNVWDSTDYVSFTPKIPGRFRWESPDQLVFSPALPLQPATTYTAKFSNEVLRYSKYNKIEGADKISFNTPALALENAQVVWTMPDEATRNVVPQLDLFFNYKIDPAKLKDRLSIEVDGKETSFAPQTVSSDTKVSFRLASFKPEDRNYETKITIGKGLAPEGGTNSIAETITENLSVPSPYVLVIQNVESEHDGTEGTIRVTTSQQLVDTDIKTFIRFDPALQFTAEIDESGLTLRSDKFDIEKSYTVSFKEGMRGRIGGELKEESQHQVAFGELEASISFSSKKGVYLSKRGAKNLEVKITSIPKIKLTISKIYESNLLMMDRYGYYPSTASYRRYEDEDYNYDYRGGGEDAMLGDIIYEKEIETRSLPKSGGGKVLNISQFEDRLPDFKGIYHIQISSMKDYWQRDSRFVSVSDIGLIAKEGIDKIVVFANSIKTAEAMNGVNVSVYSKNNQLIGNGSTNNDGVAEIVYTKKDFSGFQPAMIIAKTGDDFNYLPFSSTRVNTSRFDVGGRRANPSGLDAFVYGERDIYRPGEKINFSVIVRNREWKSPGEMPLKMKFLLPNGKELKEFRKTLNEEGSTEGSIEMALSAITGSYTLEVYTSNDLLLASQDFRIEEFVPDRIRVNTKLDKTFLKVGETTTLSVNAMNFFGPPAANRKYQTEIQTKQKYFSPAKFEKYDFSFSSGNSPISKEVREGTTDAEGKAKQVYTVPDNLKNVGVLQTTFYTTVFDETGRPVSRASSIDVFTQDVFFGIRYDGWYYHALNQPVQFKLVSVNKDGNALNAKARIEIIKREYNTHLVNTGGYFRYESQEEIRSIETRELVVGAETFYSFVPRIPGRYELRVSVPGATSYVSQSFYSYGRWGWSESNSFEVDNEGNVDIELDKKSYFAGEAVAAFFKVPFSGRMLVTMETDKLVHYQYVDVEATAKNNRTVKVDLPLTAEHVPNVYITATLIKAHELSDLPLTVAHGFQNVKVEEKSRKMQVDIVATKAVRSKTKQKVTVKAAPGSYVTLSAVDNGVLQVSNFETPDPYNFFYQKKALQVTAFDLYPLLFPEIRAKFSSTGGDGELEMSKRVNPMPAKRVKIVSYWSGIQQANGNGEASFEFSIPQFSGEIRLMAVAYKDQSFGSSENTMTVADPIVISTALPRFLSPGDTVTVPVTLSNTTAKSANISASISIEGPLKIIGINNQSIALNANSEGRAVFQVAADPSVAIGKIKIAVNGMGEKFNDETEISIRPASPLQKVSGSGSIAGGSTQKINIEVNDFIPSSIAYKLVVSRSPALELGDHLRYLVEYPYGCTEQTVSAAFPQLYYGDMADLMGLNQKLKTNANSNILEAIRKIKMRQTYKGGVMLWDNDDTEHWWATVYAAHFLLEAKKAGFDVDNSLIETMLGYINNRLKSRETITYYYNRTQSKMIAPKEVAYGLYVLALAGKANTSAMNYYKSNPQLLALDSRYLLSAAYAAAGDKRSFNSLLPSSFAGEESVPQTGGSFYSDVRDEAIALNALVDADPGNSQIGIMAKHVSDKLKSRNWLSTQERAFSFLSLGKLARAAVKSDVTADIKVNGKTIAKVDGGQWTGNQAALKGTNIDIETKGTGRLYYFWVAEGISSSGAYKEEDNYLRVRKRFYDRHGKLLTGNTFKQNDLIIVNISLERSYSTDIQNVVITDLLPAGFEIENPRTKEIPGMDWIKDAASVRSLDVRDDRIHLFVDADIAKKNFYYAVRAVSPGIYKMGPVSADAMYDGEYHSYNGAGVIKVTQ
ncbi:MAG TPA: MG2 domain-containing protein [Chitinophagaceae bacterium]